MKTEGAGHALARSEAMQLHQERLLDADRRLSNAREELARAESWLDACVCARNEFMRGQQEAPINKRMKKDRTDD